MNRSCREGDKDYTDLEQDNSAAIAMKKHPPELNHRILKQERTEI